MQALKLNLLQSSFPTASILDNCFALMDESSLGATGLCGCRARSCTAPVDTSFRLVDKMLEAGFLFKNGNHVPCSPTVVNCEAQGRRPHFSPGIYLSCSLYG